jgi:hypothetical protein
MCKLICILTTASNSNVLCGSSDPAVLVCSGVWGLFSFIGLIVYLRWQGDHSSACDEATDNPPTTAPEGELSARLPPEFLLSHSR